MHLTKVRYKILEDQDDKKILTKEEKDEPKIYQDFLNILEEAIKLI